LTIYQNKASKEEIRKKNVISDWLVPLKKPRIFWIMGYFSFRLFLPSFFEFIRGTLRLDYPLQLTIYDTQDSFSDFLASLRNGLVKEIIYIIKQGTNRISPIKNSSNNTVTGI